MADEQFNKLRNRLMAMTALQKTPIEYGEDDYNLLIVDGIKALYVDLNKSAIYKNEFDEQDLCFLNGKELLISEEEYILLKAHLNFYKMIQADVNNIVGYSTDSLSITNADKPYANISNEMSRIETRLIDLFFKVVSESDSA